MNLYKGFTIPKSERLDGGPMMYVCESEMHHLGQKIHEVLEKDGNFKEVIDNAGLSRRETSCLR